MTLSEKAKGKQRAADPEDEVGTGEQSDPGPSEITVRFTEGIPDVTFALDASYTVLDVKLLIREHRPTLLNKRLKIIVSGRLLSDDVRLREWLVAQNRRKEGQQIQANATTQSGKEKVAIVQCAVGAVIQPGEEVKESTEQELSQIRPLRGFDRLLSAGLNQRDIAILRAQFHAEHGSGYDVENVLDIPHDETSNGAVENDYTEYIVRVEEDWLDSMQSESVDGSSDGEDNGPPLPGTDQARRQREDAQAVDIVKGLVLGFFFTLIPFFFFTRPREPIFWDWDWSPPPGTRQQRRGRGSGPDLEAETSGIDSLERGEGAERLHSARRRAQPPADQQPTSTSRRRRMNFQTRSIESEWRRFYRNVVFTPTTRMAIAAGMGINILFGLWRLIVASA